MKVFLIVTLMLMGQQQPAQHAEPMKDLKRCEAEAHKFMTHEFPKDVASKITFRSAACAMGVPGKDA